MIIIGEQEYAEMQRSHIMILKNLSKLYEMYNNQMNTNNQLRIDIEIMNTKITEMGHHIANLREKNTKSV